MLSFLAVGFAVAGIAAAAGPVIIHLLNRRRHRTVNWAAMDFLREAMQRNRKTLQLRDVLLLLLRVSCVLLFGLALARPYLTAGWQSLSGVLIGTALAALVTLIALAWMVVASGRVRWVAGLVCLAAAAGCGLGVYSASSAALLETTAAVSDHAPVHAVLVLDNSMSMGCQSLGGTRLDEARSRARAFLDELPAESRMTIIPLCGSASEWSLDACRTREDARDALDRIEVVDRAGSAARAVELAIGACKQVPELEARRIVFLSDQQLTTWQAAIDNTALKQLPELQVVQVGTETPANLAVTSLTLRDGVADVETPSSFLARIRYDGSQPLDAAQVTLQVAGSPVASRTVSLEPGQERELEFRWQFDASVEPGRPAFVPVSVAVRTDSSLGDSLPRDNQRHLAVPVVAGIPVVFIDQLGSDGEIPQQNLYGETYRLRRWLAPRQRDEEHTRQLIRIRHLTVDQVDIESLQDARMVVLAGVKQPGGAVPLLREYLLQGGQLLIAAGGEFDPVSWNSQAWLDGQGILPAPLEPEPFGQSLEETSATGQLNPFLLDTRSLEHNWFLIEGSSREELEDLFRTPLFFKAVQVPPLEDYSRQLLAAEQKRIESELAFVQAARQREAEWEQLEQQGQLGETEQAQQAADRRRLRELNPQWWVWRDPSATIPDPHRTPAEQARDGQPSVLASWEGNNLPFLVERRIGQGRAVLVTTGTGSGWNVRLTDGSAIILFDRILRSLLESSLPDHNYAAGENIVLPVDRSEELEYRLSRPAADQSTDAPLQMAEVSAEAGAGTTEPNGADSDSTVGVTPAGGTSPLPADGTASEILPVEATGKETFGIRVRDPLIAGHYSVTSWQTPENSDEAAQTRIREQVLAVNSPAAESDLRTLSAEGLLERLGPGNWRWVAPGEPIPLEGAAVHGRDLWKLLLKLVLAGLLLEMLILARPGWRRRRAETAPGTLPSAASPGSGISPQPTGAQSR